MSQRVIITRNFNRDLAVALSECDHDRIFVLVDDTTREKCWKSISGHLCLKNAHVITISSTDTNKTLETVAHVWEELGKGGGTRHSCMINLGGGMVTDLGGFAASTFKRGIDFINIPTTLLAMVDASVGGKTGFNFNGLKNEIGVFSESKFVIMNTEFLETLDVENMYSGYAEMLKHGLISDERMWAELLSFDLDDANSSVWHDKLSRMLADSIAVKERIVAKDPNEHGLRKALNFGHTFGHAFESWALKRTPVLHGYAVAYGMVCELYLSVTHAGFPADKMRQTVTYIREHYGMLPVTCDDYDELIAFMRHDKKNRGNDINCTFLGGIGDIRIDNMLSEEEIKEALDFYCFNC